MASQHLELPIAGMTCASCANRVEREPEPASTAWWRRSTTRPSGPPSTYDPRRRRAGAARERCGGGGLQRGAAGGRDGSTALAAPPPGRRAPRCRCRCCCCRWCRALQFDGWQWVAFALATPVVLWGAWPFHAAAWANLRHGAATMDTLVSSASAWLWSLSRCWSRAERSCSPARTTATIYFETAAVITTSSSPAATSRRARSGAPATRSGRCSSSAPRTWRCSTRTAPSAACRSTSSAAATASWCGRARRSRPTASWRRARRRVDMSMLTGESVPVEVGPGDEVAGATVNAGGRLVVRATRVGADTAARPDRPARDRGAGRQGAGAAARRPRLGRLRARRDRARRSPRSASGSHRRHADGRVHRRGRRADHRLPVRARARHAHRADGRHRPRRPARPPDQGAGGPRVDPRASTRSCSTRPARSPTGRMSLVDVTVGAGRRRATRPCGSPGALEDASEHPVARAIAPRAAGERGRCRRVEALRATVEGLGVEGTSTAARCSSAGRRCSPSAGIALPPELADARAAPPRRAGRPRSPPRGTAQARAVFVVADTRQADVGRGGRRARAARPAPGAAHRRQRDHRAGRGRGGGHRRGDRRGAARGQGRRGPAASRPRAAWSPWSATA